MTSSGEIVDALNHNGGVDRRESQMVCVGHNNREMGEWITMIKYSEVRLGKCAEVIYDGYDDEKICMGCAMYSYGRTVPYAVDKHGLHRTM